MTIENILNSLGETKGHEFEMFYQFLNEQEKQAVVDSDVDPLILYSVLLATQGSCSTSALEKSTLIELLDAIKLKNPSLSDVEKALEKMGSDGLSVQEVIEML